MHSSKLYQFRQNSNPAPVFTVITSDKKETFMVRDSQGIYFFSHGSLILLLLYDFCFSNILMKIHNSKKITAGKKRYCVKKKVLVFKSLRFNDIHCSLSFFIFSFVCIFLFNISHYHLVFPNNISHKISFKKVMWLILANRVVPKTLLRSWRAWRDFG